MFQDLCLAERRFSPAFLPFSLAILIPTQERDLLLELKIHRTEINQLHKEFEISIKCLVMDRKATSSYNMKNPNIINIS